MFNRYKKYFMIVMFVLLSLGITHGFAFAYSQQITLDAIEDAGEYPTQGAYVGFRITTGNVTTDISVDTAVVSQFTNSAEVYTYASQFSNASWVLQSAGNAWSSTDKIVGESLENLQAGTYRITPAGGAYMYDAFGWWTADCSYKYWWELHIKVQDGSREFVETLGSSGKQDTQKSAFDSVKNQFEDITLTEGGSLSFWIYDWNSIENYGNSIDNYGGLTFNVTSVPEPSTTLLLTLGLAFLMWRIRNQTIKS